MTTTTTAATAAATTTTTVTKFSCLQTFMPNGCGWNERSTRTHIACARERMMKSTFKFIKTELNWTELISMREFVDFDSIFYLWMIKRDTDRQTDRERQCAIWKSKVTECVPSGKIWMQYVARWLFEWKLIIIGFFGVHSMRLTDSHSHRCKCLIAVRR